MSESPSKPVRNIRRGMVQAAIWRNTNDKGVFFVTTFERRYRDSSEAWKSTHGFGRDDLLVLARVAGLAHDAIFELQQAERDGGADKANISTSNRSVSKPKSGGTAGTARGTSRESR